MAIEKVERLAPLQLAFIGDAVYEIKVRCYLLDQCQCPPAELHKQSVSLVCAKAQCQGVKAILDQLTEQELAIFKRGRNAHPSHSPKSASAAEYSYATGLECLLGYLHLKGQDERINDLFNCIISSIH